MVVPNYIFRRGGTQYLGAVVPRNFSCPGFDAPVTDDVDTHFYTVLFSKFVTMVKVRNLRRYYCFKSLLASVAEFLKAANSLAYHRKMTLYWTMV